MSATRKMIAIAGCVGMMGPRTASAGMPSPLPSDPATVLLLNHSALARLQAISFFLIVFLGSAGLLRLAWNFLQRDFPSLPRLTYSKSLAVVFLWGLLFIIVLTMISGARELMTPGAWTKDGFTYKLTDASSPPSETQRRAHFEKLRTALWHFAATHQGRFPSESETNTIAFELWESPGSMAGSPTNRIQYVAGKSAGFLPEILAYEPENVSDQRLALKANGDIAIMSSAELTAALQGEALP